MTTDNHSLMSVFKGWDGYQVSLVRAIAPLSREQLVYKSAPHLRSASEIARHTCGASHVLVSVMSYAAAGCIAHHTY